MYKGQGGRACNSNFQYISDNKNLTPHSGHKKNVITEQKILCKLFSQRTVELNKLRIFVHFH